jgi:outer membrane protein
MATFYPRENFAMPRHFHLFKLLSLSALLLAPASYAQTSDFVYLRPELSLEEGDNLSMGAIMLSSPAYSGANTQRTQAFPLIDAQWKGGAFASVVSGLGYNFSANPQLQYGLRLGYNPGRDTSVSSALNGMGDIAIRPVVGGFDNYLVTPQLSVLSSVQYGAGNDHNGLELNLGVRISTAISAQHQLSLTVSAKWANQNYMQSFYGVNATQSANSAYAVTTPATGLVDTELFGNWNWQLNSHWSWMNGLSFKHLSVSSPLLQKSSQLSLLSAVSYRY